MKKSTALIALAVASLFAITLVGCVLNPTVTYEDIQGEWDFFDVVFNSSSIGDVHLSVLPPSDGVARIDLFWNDGDNFYYGDGTMDGDTFSGAYNIGGDLSETSYAITTAFSMSGDKLKAEFVGDGPLDGLVLEAGEPTPDA
ncbi:MAG: hypothetical protein WAX33_11515 [Rectinemataceae bacterium]